MKFEDGVYQRGNARVIIRSDPASNRFRMYVLVGLPNGHQGVVTMDDGSMVIEILDPGVEVSDEDVMLVWSAQEDITDTIEDVFGAMALALGMGGDERTAREMGRLEGENNVYKMLFDKAPPPPTPEPMNDWTKYINDHKKYYDGGYTTITSPNTSPGWVSTSINGLQPRLPDPGPMQVSHTHDIHAGIPYDHQREKDINVMKEAMVQMEGPFGGAP